MFPDTVYIGTLCTACSGILNLFLMVKAHSDARGLEEPGLGQLPVSGVCLLGWLVPGAGHYAQGRRTRALIVFVLLTGLLVLGTWLADASNLDRERHFYYWGGQLMGGLPAIGLEQLWGHPGVRGEIKYAEAGLVLASLAGLLNILAILDVYSWGEARALEGMSSEGGATHRAKTKEASA